MRFILLALLLLCSPVFAGDVDNPQTNASALTVGTLPTARMPALTGDCTTSAGAVATTCLKTNGVNFTAGATAAIGQLPGTTTNDSANAGNVGQFLSNTGSTISLTSGTVSQAATITLTAGDWDVWGAVQFIPAAGTTTSSIIGLVSLTSASISAIDGPCFTSLAYAGTAGATQSLPIGACRVSITSNTPVYVNIDAFFSVSTMQGTGIIYARRRR